MRESIIKGGIPVLLSTILLICVDQFTSATIPSRLLDIVVANLFADLLIICVAFYSCIVPKKSKLLYWYTKYGLSAVLMDTLIGVIYMVSAYELIQVLSTDRLLYFGLLSIAIQWIGDLAFAILIFGTPPHKNAIIDFFKDYAREAQLGALLGDTFLINVGVLFSSLLELISNTRYVVYILILISYFIPYVVHTNDGRQQVAPISAIETTKIQKRSFRHIKRRTI